MKILFNRPRNTDVVLLYPENERLFKDWVFKSISYQMLDVARVVYLHPIVIVKTFKWFKKILFKEIFLYKNILKIIYESHLLAIIEFISPKVIITFIDDSGVFHRLSRRYYKAKFIAVQNGLRPKCFFKYLLPTYSNQSYVVSMPSYYCFGKSTVNAFVSQKSIIDEYHPIGSFVGGIYWGEYSQPVKCKYDICYVSSWVDIKRLPDMSGVQKTMFMIDLKAIEVLERNLQKLISEKNYSVAIAFKYKNNKNEHKYFYKKFTNTVKYIDSNIEEFSTYKTIDKSNLTLTTYSTCGAEAFGMGKKVLFFNGSGDSSIGVQEAGYCYLENDDYEKFRDHICELLSMTNNEYISKVYENMQYMMNYNNADMPHLRIRKSILSSLKKPN